MAAERSVDTGTEQLLCTIQHGVATLTLNRPDARNALSPDMALAAADQGRFEPFHYAMFAKDRPSAATIEAAAREAGIDLARARADIASGKYDAELQRNVGMNEAIGLTGTPGWVAGDMAFSGAVGQGKLNEAVTKARKPS